MNAEQRIRLAIGDLVIQLQAALAEVEGLRAQLVKRDKPEVNLTNGKDDEVQDSASV